MPMAEESQRSSSELQWLDLVMGVKGARGAREKQRYLRIPQRFNAPRGVARCTTDLTFTKASSEAGAS